MSRRRVAVVVLADVEAVDDMDAANAVSLAVRAKLAGSARVSLPIELPIPLKRRATSRPGVVDVMDLGMAAGNGYLWTYPTHAAWRDRGLTLDGEGRDDA